MLVDTPFETVSQLENVVQKYVNNKIEYRSKEVLVNDFTLEDVRLELSSSARKHTFIVDKAVKQPNESFVSDIHIKPLNMDILDIIPLDLREQFKYEQGMTDASRTQLLQKNLTIVTLIQNIQNQLKEEEVVEEDDFLVEPTEVVASMETDVQVNTLVDTSTPISTEIEDFSLEDEGETIEEQATQEIDDFSLDSDEELSNPLENVSQIDDFSLDDEEPETDLADKEQTEDIDDFVLDETEPTIDDFSLEEEPTVDDCSLDEEEEPKLDDFTLEDTTISANTEDFSLDDVEEPSNSVITQIDNEPTTQPLSELELFKQAIGNVKESVPKVTKTRTNVDDEEPIIEDLDSISEDELDTDELDTDESDITEDLSDTDEDENDIEDESDDFEDIDDFDPEIDSSSDSIPSAETDIEKEDSEDLEDIDWDADDEVDKTEDNVEFTDTTSVNITKVAMHIERPTQASEWGKSLEQKANNSLGSQSGTQDFKQQFDKEEDESEIVPPEQVTKTFVENISREEKPVARAPSQASVTQDKQELPPLRLYLKKHAYTPIQTLIEMGYSDMEIKDGIKRGRFIIKRGTLRALY